MLAILSGVISEYLKESEFLIFYGAGVIFGVIFGIWFLVAEKTNILKTLFWVIASGLAYYIAVNTYILNTKFYTRNYILGFDADTLPFILAGTIGSFILAIGTHYLIQKLKWWQILIIVLLGSAGGAYFNLDGQSFIIWQVPVGTAIGILVHRNKTLVI